MKAEIKLNWPELERLVGRAGPALRALGIPELAYEADSVLKVDDWINRHRHEVSPPGRELVAGILGGFVGECMYRDLVCEWTRVEDDWGIQLPRARLPGRLREVIFFPLRRVRRQMLAGEQESIALMYLLAGGLCERALVPWDPRLLLVGAFDMALDRGLKRPEMADCEDGLAPVRMRLVGAPPPEDAITQPPDALVWMSGRTRSGAWLELARFRRALTRAPWYRTPKGDRNAN